MTTTRPRGREATRRRSRCQKSRIIGWLTHRQHRKIFDARRTSHPGYLGMLGGSGGCVAAWNSAARPRKITSIRAANSARPPPRQEPPVILEHFVVPDQRRRRASLSLCSSRTCTGFYVKSIGQNKSVNAHHHAWDHSVEHLVRIIIIILL